MKLAIAMMLLLVMAVLVTGTIRADTPVACNPNDANYPQECCASLPSSISGALGGYTWYCPINYAIYQQWQTELPIAVVAVLLAFSIASIAVMIGIAFKSDRIRNFGIAEIYEAIASAIIVGIFVYVCAVMFGVFPGILVGAINPYATALNLITSTLGTAQNLFSSIYNVYYVLKWVLAQDITYSSAYGASFSLQSTLSFLTLPLSIGFLDPARAIAFFLVDGMLALWSEYYVLVFFSIAAIPVFIVPGVVFRAFLPTRALGGTMMAIGISFYLVMPSMFAIAFYLTSPSVQSSMSASAAQMNRFGSDASSAAANAAGPDSPLAMQLQNVQANMSSFWLLVLFYPALIIGMVYATIAQFSSFLGGTYGNANKIRSFV